MSLVGNVYILYKGERFYAIHNGLLCIKRTQQRNNWNSQRPDPAHRLTQLTVTSTVFCLRYKIVASGCSCCDSAEPMRMPFEEFFLKLMLASTQHQKCG
jgi:hypothetical protein